MTHKTTPTAQDTIALVVAMSYLSRILYASRSSAQVGADELNDILEVSRKKNRLLQITGILCAGGGHFIQILEGPQDELIRLYSRILDDPRHYDSVLIGVAPIQQRIFKNWSMGYIENPPDIMEANRNQLLEMWRGRTEAHQLFTLMREFLDQLDR